MDDNARRYILNVGSIMSCGLSACTTFQECSLLNAFTVTTGNTTCSFPTLTLDNLKSLSLPDYDKRVGYFFEHVGIQESRLKNNLLTGATFYNQDCDIICKLNPDFLVYRFLDGVRVVNTGEANGEIEYIAYPIDDDPSGYTWQTSGTFLGLDLSKIYVFKIRDNFNGDVVCEYQKQLSLPLLLPSTTVTLTPIEISLNERLRGLTLGQCYSYSDVISTPELTSGQRVSVSYITNSLVYGGGESCLMLYCKRPIDTTFQEYKRITNTSSLPQTNTFEINSTTDWCYTMIGRSPFAGSYSQINFSLSSVNGLGTTIPSIDLGNCSLSITNQVPPINVTASTYQTSSTPTIKNGYIRFVQPVPEGNCAILQMSATTKVTGPANACVTFFCKPNGSTSPPVQINKTFGGATCTPTIIARNGDLITYNMTVSAQDPGTSANAEFCINSMSGSYGVNTYISPDNYESISAATPTISSIVSICSQNNTTTNPLSSDADMDGYINATNIGSGQCVRVNLITDVLVPNGSAKLQICCNKGGNSSFVNIFSCSSTGTGSESFFMCQGDIVCYCGEIIVVPSGNPEWGYSCLRLDSVQGYNGLSASINSNGAKQYDYAEAEY